MIRLFSNLILLLAFCHTALAVESTVIIKGTFSYNGLHAADVTEKLILSSDKQHYTIDRQTKAVGLAKLLYGDVISHSTGLLHPEHGLMTTLYFQKRNGKEQQATYDIKTKQLALSKGDSQKTATVKGFLYDYLTSAFQSYVLQKPISGEIEVTNGWRYKAYDFTVGAEETIETEMGAIKAIPISRKSKRGKRTIWVAPSLKYLVVRSYIDDKGHIFETFIQSIEITK